MRWGPKEFFDFWLSGRNLQDLPRCASTPDYSSVRSKSGPALTRNPQGEVWEGLNGQLGVLLGGVRSIAYFASGCVTVGGVGALLTRESSSASRVLLGFLYVSMVDGSLAIRLNSTPSLCPWKLGCHHGVGAQSCSDMVGLSGVTKPILSHLVFMSDQGVTMNHRDCRSFKDLNVCLF